MLKILVPTDLGRDSRSGIRFAIHLAVRQKAELIFFHAAYIPGLTRWSEKQYNSFRQAELDLRHRKLRQLVTGVYARMGIRPQRYACLIAEGISPEITLQAYCREHPDIDFICMGTHGAAGLEKFWGTHAGNMVTHSPIPVIVVPKGYRTRPLTSLLYATDLVRYQEELRKIAPLAHQLRAELHVLHLVDGDERMPDPRIFQQALQQEFHIDLHLHFENMDETRSTVTNLHRYIRQIKPSLVIMFTDQQRTLFEKIFFPSRTENLAFRTHTALLAFPKTTEAG